MIEVSGGNPPAKSHDTDFEGENGILNYLYNPFLPLQDPQLRQLLYSRLPHDEPFLEAVTIPEVSATSTVSCNSALRLPD